MRTQAISMQNAYITRKTSDSTNFKNGTTYVIVPTEENQDSFVKWASKSVITASVFSALYDLGHNAAVKMNWLKNAEMVSGKQMMKNIPQVAGVFLLIGGIFKVVSDFIDKKNS